MALNRFAASADVPLPFDRRQTRLRDLKEADPGLNLPPLYAQEEKAVQRLEAFDASLAPARADAGLQAPERAALDRDLLVQKSRARIEKLKDIRAGLELVRERLSGETPPDGQALAQLRSLIQSGQSLLRPIYDGQLIEGLESVRPLVVNCVEKLGCAQPGQSADFGALRERDASMSAALKAPNAVPVMEKAALLALAETVDKVIEKFLALSDDKGAGEDEALLRQHQPSLQLLQRAGRSQQEMLTQLTVLHNQLGDIQELMSLNLLKSSMDQLRRRSLRELKGMAEIIETHLPGLAPLLPLLKSQHQRLEQTSTREFLNRKIRYSLPVTPPATPGLPEAIQPMLDEYTLTTEKVVVAFEALTGQSLEKDQDLTLEGELADLDALLGGI